MKKLKKIILAAATLLAVHASHAAVINVTSNITASTTWSKTNTYILNGFIYVKNNATLTIQAGTVIKGDKASKGTLIVTRGAKLIANGTETQPIVFTSNQPVGSRTYGDWGGVILLGKATINPTGGTAVIEGGFTAPDGEYGGTDDDDNSGSLKYVRIEYCGIPFQPNNEINGLTCGGVGRGTVLEHIQVSYSGDDGFEFFGGTVNAKWLISYRNLDDDFDTDFGFRGKFQFCVALRDPAAADVSGSNGFESDNDATGSSNTPLTNAIFSNVSIIGPSNGGSINSNYKRAAHLRRNTGCSIYNSVLMAFPVGLLIDGTAAENNATSNFLQFQNNIIAGCATSLAVNSGSSFDIATWFSSQGGNNTYSNNSDVNLTDAFNLSNPNFLPQTGSPALSGASFSNTRLQNAFFTPVSYRGAFGSENWTKCWAEWDPQNQTYPSSTAMNLATVPTISITSGVNPHCEGVNLTMTAAPSGLTYQWYKGTSAINGATNIDYTTSASGGHKVLATNGRGCSAYSSVISISVPIPSVTISGDDNLCFASSVLLTANSSTATSYQWMENGANITGQTASTYTASDTGSFQVRVTNSTGCTKISSAKKVKNTLSAPVISFSGPSGICPPEVTQLNVTPVTGLSYKWQNKVGSSYQDITGATGLSYTVTLPGIYRVFATSAMSCTKTSGTKTVSNTCRTGSELAQEQTFSFFPNPASDMASLRFELENPAQISVDIFDVTGKKIMEVINSSLESGSYQIATSLSGLQNGIYVYRVLVDGNQEQVGKLLIQK